MGTKLKLWMSTIYAVHNILKQLMQCVESYIPEIMMREKYFWKTEISTKLLNENITQLSYRQKHSDDNLT